MDETIGTAFQKESIMIGAGIAEWRFIFAAKFIL